MDWVMLHSWKGLTSMISRCARIQRDWCLRKNDVSDTKEIFSYRNPAWKPCVCVCACLFLFWRGGQSHFVDTGD